MKEKEKIISLIISLVILGIIAGGAFFHLNGVISSENGEVEAEVIEGVADEGETLAGMLQDEATEESIEHDARKLEVNVDNGESSEAPMQSEAPQTENPVVPPTVAQPRGSAAGELKIGFVTDIHARSHSDGDGTRNLKEFFTDGINYFINRMDKSFRPDFILNDGDVIEGTGRSSKIGKKELALIKNLFDETAISKYWVVGNHDLRSVKKKQWKETLGIGYLHDSFEAGNYKIIILDSNFTADDKDVEPDVYNTRGRISEKELAWLKEELENTGKEIIIFMHHPPLWNVDLKANGSMPGNAPALRDIFSRRKVIAVFAGHFEDLYINETGGVKYFVLPGFIKNKKYQKTFSEITVKNGEIVVDMSYLADEKKYRTVRITD